MRVGILGGTFNPIHFGHIYPACEAAEKLKLDKVLFIPAYSPPHKPDGEIISAYHRKNMIKLAIEDYPYFELSPLEIDRKGISYSVDTVTALVKKEKDNSFFFIIGLDAFLEIDTWKDANRLLKSCNFIVVTRDEVISDQLETVSKNLSEKFRDFQFHPGEVEPESRLKCIKANSSPYFIVPLETTPVNISSTDIREKIKRGDSIKKLVPKNVYIYIENKLLYV
tara:strand:+ start:709 stop:1380 length:672 start_codon:yes stop_codon:yes gene_type:complete